MEREAKSSPFETLRWTSAIGLGMAVAVVSLFGVYKEYEELFRKDTLHFVESIFLSLVSIGLFFQYWWNSSKELEMFVKHVGEGNSPIIKIQTYAVIIFLGIFFGILISMSHKILIYCIFIIVYSLLDLWGSWQYCEGIRPLIEKELSIGNHGPRHKVIQAIHEYYFKNPTLQRIVTIMFFSWIAFTFALLAIYEQNSSRILQSAAYITVGLNIIVSEWIITKWRIRRDRNIKTLREET